MVDLQGAIARYLAKTFDISESAAAGHADSLVEDVEFYAALYAHCPAGCGCLLDGEDADRNECGCGDACCAGEVAFVREGEVVALVQTKRLTSGNTLRHRAAMTSYRPTITGGKL